MGHYLKFWGTRGSCAVSGPQYKRFGGNSSCLEIRYGGTLAILDAGTGILPLGSQLLTENITQIHLFLSHLHWDHVIGFPFFKPIYKPHVQVTVYGPQGPGRSLKELFGQIFSEEFFPVGMDPLPAKLEFRSLHPGEPVLLGDLAIDVHPVCHPYATHCFRIKTPCETIGYVTDNEIQLPFQQSEHQSLIDFFKRCGLFIHEVQYSREEIAFHEGWGHSSPMGVVSLVQHIEPVRWIVTHHDPDHSDRDLKQLCRMTKRLLRETRTRCPVEWTFDGAVIELENPS